LGGDLLPKLPEDAGYGVAFRALGRRRLDAGASDLGLQRVGCALRHDAPLVDDPDAVRQDVGLFEVLRGEEHRDAVVAREVVSKFGDCLKASNGNVAVSLNNGVADVAPIVRALDEAGLLVESLDVVEPTLDDVFLATTGQVLEGSDEPS